MSARTIDEVMEGRVCEWDPDTNTEAMGNSEHCEPSAFRVVDDEGDDYYVCAQCAKLPAFDSYKTRIPVSPATESGEPGTGLGSAGGSPPGSG